MDHDKIVSKNEENLRFFNRWSKTYDWTPFQWWMRAFHGPIKANIDYSQPFTLLDISCGTGELLRSIFNKSRGEAQLSGFDLSEKMLDKARAKLPTAIQLQQGDVHQLPYRQDSFDYVVTTEAFHHFADQERALREMKRVAKNHGYVAVADINFFFPWIHKIFERFEPGCVKVNSKEEMTALFKRAGLHIERQERHGLFSVTTIAKKSLTHTEKKQKKEKI